MTGTQQERTVRTCPPGADSGGWQSVPVEILINLPTPTLWLPVPVPSVPQQGWSSAPHSPALPRVRSCCLRGAASSLSLHSCSLHRVPSSAWLPGHSLAPMAEGSSSHKPHTSKVPCCSTLAAVCTAKGQS